MTFLEFIVSRLNYWIYIILMMLGLFAMITKKNLIKKLIGMSIFQTAIILFFVSIGVKEGSTIPILTHQAAHDLEHGQTPSADHGENPVHSGSADTLRAEDYANPLPHVLMLTAIVVGVATLGVGLAVVQKLHQEFGTIEEPEILAKINSGDG